jgi:nucleoside-diphosphate-sugar epimerase
LKGENYEEEDIFTNWCNRKFRQQYFPTLISAGETVRGLARDPGAARVNKEAEISPGDVLDVSSLESFFSVEEDTDIYVIHCASVVAPNLKTIDKLNI